MEAEAPTVTISVIDIPADSVMVVFVRLDGEDLKFEPREVIDAIQPPREQIARVFQMAANYYQSLAGEAGQ